MLLTVINSEQVMKSTRRPQRAFAAGQRQRPAKPWAEAKIQGSKDDQAHWHRRHQHYLSLAEGADNADRVDRENYRQHAEHFYRLIAEAAGLHRQASVGTSSSTAALSIL